MNSTSLNLYKRKKSRLNPEAQIQAAIVKLLRLNKIFVFHVANEGTASVQRGSMLKAMGTMPGVSDLIILKSEKIYLETDHQNTEWQVWEPRSAIFVEVKTKTGVQSPAQKIFQKEIESRGFVYYIWRSVDDAAKWLR